MTCITRFAPSPTGLLHLGHAYSAMTAWRFAQGRRGRFLVRIEDIDSTRCKPEFTTAIFEDLAWLGLDWEKPVRQQSDHFAIYEQALQQLQSQNLVYPCFCTRSDVAAEIALSPTAPHGPITTHYPGTCKTMSVDERAGKLKANQAFALRLDSEKAAAQAGLLTWHDAYKGKQHATPELLCDPVLARKEVPTSYHLAVVVDDGLQGVTDIVRGEDLFVATHVQRLLQALLGLPTPRYHHHKLLTDANGKRLAKRDKALTLRSLRDAGHQPQDVYTMIGLAE
jgi:glutamyl-Q tRNA(Asp) synthetase